MLLDPSFYRRSDVAGVAKGLIGKLLVTKNYGKLTAGIIVETEAYSHTERGCHAYQNKMTQRNKIMFSDGGRAYIYLCYGIHHLFNVVTNVAGVADAVLIRALEPTEGISQMIKRMKAKTEKRITSGPGKLTEALGIDLRQNGEKLYSGRLWIEDAGNSIKSADIIRSKRIGIDYAGEDALLPWRFSLKDNLWISK